MSKTSGFNYKEIEERVKSLKNPNYIHGPSSLTIPRWISSSRTNMVTNQQKQTVVLLEPEVPKLFTNYENIAGKHSTGYYKAKRNYEVIAKIPRFKNGIDDNALYYLIVYNEEDDYYDIIEKKSIENLTEKFGYSYNTDVIDEKEVGDMIEEDEVLYRSTSYDEDMNYQYGRNINVMYSLATDTIEDCIVARRGLCKEFASKEVELIKISLNDNDIFCNIYGDNDEYKTFPDIGELVQNKIVACKRRIHNNQVLFDLKKSNLRKINYDNDTPFYSEGRVVDIYIRSNKPLEEVDDNKFNSQIRKYLAMQTEFYEDMYDECEKIIHSGSKYSKDISYMFKTSRDILDPNVKWREENGSIPSNMSIEFLVERNSELTVGQKITGRMGNKGVVGKILPDEEMPYLEDGTPVDIIINGLGVVNRLNPLQLFEMSINFITVEVSKKLATMSKLKDKENLLFDIIHRFSKAEEKALKEYYKGLSTAEKKEYFKEIEDTHDIYINIPPNNEDESEPPLFDVIRDIYKDYPWIKPIPVYINKFGRKIRVMRDIIIGQVYFVKLKQSSKKGFSARSTGSISKKDVPEKSYRTKEHQDLYSTTPIRVGIDENNNSAIAVDPKIIARLHQLYRSSPVGRRELGEKLSENIKPIKMKKKKNKHDNDVNRNAEVLNAYFVALGLKIVFPDEMYTIDPDVGGVKTFETDNGGIIIGDNEDYDDYRAHRDADEYFKYYSPFIGTNEEFEEAYEEEVEKRKNS